MVDRASNQDDEFYRNLSRRCSGSKDVPIVSLRLELLINEINPMVMPESDTMADGSGLSNETKPEMLPARAKTSHQDTSTVGANNRWVLDIIQNLKPTILEQSYLERSLLTSDEPSLPHTKQARQQTTYAPELSTPEPSIVSLNNLDQDNGNASSDEEDLMFIESGSDRTKTNFAQIIEKPSSTDRAHVNKKRGLFIEYLQIKASIAAPTGPDTGIPLNLVIPFLGIPTVLEEFLQLYIPDEERILSKIAKVKASLDKSAQADKIAAIIQDEADLAVVTFKSFLHSVQEQHDAMYYEEMQLMLSEHGSLAETPYDSALVLFGKGLASLKLKDYEESFEKFREAELILQECVRFDKSISNDLSLFMGDAEISQGHYKSAPEYFERAIASHLHHGPPSQLEEIFKLERTTLSTMLSKLALSLRNDDRVVDSKKRYKQAMSCPDATSSDIIVAHTGLGNLLHSLGSNEKAVPEYLAAIDKAEEEKDHLSLAWAHGNLGNTYLSLGKREKGLSHLQTSLDLTLDHDFDPSSISRALNNLGTAYQPLNELDKAELYFDQALSQAIYASDVVGQARAYGNIGNVYMLLKDFLKATPHYTEVLRLSRDRSTVYVAYHNCGCALFELAEKKKGEQYQFTKRGEFQFIAIGPDTGDMDYKHQPDEELDDHTTELYQQSLKDLRKVIKNVESAFSKSSSSTTGLDLYLSLFHINAKTFQKAQDCAFNLRDHYLSLTIAEQVRARTLGELLLKKKSHQLPTTFSTPLNIDAIKLAVELLPDPYTPVVVLSYTCRDRSTVYVAHHNCGCALFELTKYQFTKRGEFQFIAIGPDTGDMDYKHQPDEELDDHTTELYQQALKDLRKVIKNVESAFSNSSSSTIGLDLYLSLFHINAKTFQRAQDCAFNLRDHYLSLTITEQVRARTLGELLLKHKSHQLPIAFSTPLNIDAIKLAVELLPDPHTPVVVLSYTGTRLLVWVLVFDGKTVSVNSFEQETDKELFGKQLDIYLRYELADDLTGNIDLYIEEEESGEVVEIEEEGGNTDEEKKIESDEEKKQESDGEEKTEDAKKYSSKYSSHMDTNKLDDTEIVEKTKKLVKKEKGDRRNGPARKRKILSDLYKMIAKPLEAILKAVIPEPILHSRGPHKLILIPDNSTKMILINAILNEEGGVYFGDKHTLQFFPSLLCLSIMSQAPPTVIRINGNTTGDVLIVGDPSTPAFKFEGEDWTPGPLPHAKKEAEWVGHYMGTPPLLGGEPTKEVVLAKLSQAKLIHLATHGSATYGFVLLAGHCYDRQTTLTSSLRYHEDEKKLLLYASEIESLRLQSCLVILSSCDSGRGKFKGDEIQGMSRSFLLAGAAAVMTSLWKVPDQSASYFMEYFYRYLLDGHTSSGDVLIVGDPSTPAFKFEGEDWTPGPLPHAKTFISLNLKIEELQLMELNKSLDLFPDSFAYHKVLPHLLNVFEFGGAGPTVLAPLLKIGKLLPEDEYQRKIVPCIVRSFGSNDRATRLNLLQHLDQFIDQLQPNVLNNSLFGQIVTGFTDTVPTIREHTIKASLLLAPKLNDSNLSQLLKFFAKCQLDEQAGIRTNTTICLRKIAPHLNSKTRDRVLVSAFTRSLKDPFPPARSAGIGALGSTLFYYTPVDMATRIIPSLSHMTIDKDQSVREQAHKVLKLYVDKLEEHLKKMEPSSDGEGIEQTESIRRQQGRKYQLICH